MKSLAILLSLVVVTGCYSVTSSGSTAVLGEKFQVKYGQQVRLENEGVTVKLDSVFDGRCPLNAECFWAGNARIVLSFNDASLSLNTTVDPKEASYRQYNIRLISLNPYPATFGGADLKKYVAELLVTKQ